MALCHGREKSQKSSGDNLTASNELRNQIVRILNTSILKSEENVARSVISGPLPHERQQLVHQKLMGLKNTKTHSIEGNRKKINDS